MPIDYKSHIELFRNWSFHEFYHLKALITSEQVITSVVEKKTIFISKTLRFILENQDRGLGIENWDWGSGISDS